MKRPESSAERQTDMDYMDLVETISDCIWEVDENSCYKYVSPSIKGILGYEPEEILGKTPFDLMPPKEAKRVEKICLKITRAGGPFRLLENLNLHKEGHEVMLETSGIAVFDKNGRFRGYRGVDRDITDRKYMEHALEESEARYRTLFENSIEGIGLSKGNRVVSANRSLLEIFGYDDEKEFKKIPLLYHVAPESRKNIEDRMRQRKKGESIESRFKYQIIRKNGEMRDIEISSVEIPIGKENYSLSTFRDVTAQKLSEKNLEQSEEKYRDLFENANDAIFLVDKDLNYTDVNNRAVELFGYSKEEFLNMNIMDVIPAQQIPMSSREFDVLRGMGKYEKFIGRIKTKHGKWIDVEVNSSAIYKNGQIVGSRDIVRDITERKRSEDALKRYAKELEHSNNLKDLFSDIIRHDLLNPIGTIKTTTELALEEFPGSDYLESISRNSQKAIELIEDATMLSHLESGEKFSKKSMDLRLLIEAVSLDLIPLFRQKGIKIENQIKEPMEILANPMIPHVFINILTNAAKYASESEKVIIRGEDRGKMFRISIIDEGPGIPDENKKEIFTRFKRTNKESVKGSGLGLAIANRLVELHGGKIWVEDNPDGGAVFVVELPK